MMHGALFHTHTHTPLDFMFQLSSLHQSPGFGCGMKAAGGSCVCTSRMKLDSAFPFSPSPPVVAFRVLSRLFC